MPRSMLWIGLHGALCMLCTGLVAGSTGCKGDPPASEKNPEAPDRTDTKAASPAGAEVPEGEPVPSRPAEPPPPLVRAEAPATTSAKSAPHLGFKLEALQRLHALEGTPAGAPWGAVGRGDPQAMRDDDLDTSWTCTPEADRPCAAGLGFSETVEIAAVRLYAAAGPKWTDYQGHPRVASIRIHTDAGHVDATVEDGAAHRYVILDPPVRTRTIAIEVLGTHKGRKKDGAIHLAELEVYGSQGPKRPPTDFDPEDALVAYETEAWKAQGSKHVIRQAFLGFARPGAAPSRWVRGTAVFGKKGDRFLLVEKLYGTSCGDHQGSYILFDQHTRMFLPLGELGGAPGRVRRHAQGLGFAIAHDPDDPTALKAVVPDGDAIAIARAPRREGTDPAVVLQGWGIVDEPLRRGGRRLEEPPDGCKPPSKDDPILGQAGLTGRYPETATDRWLVCDLDGGARVVFGDGSSCAGTWSIVVVDGQGAVVAERHSDPASPGRGVRVTRMPAVGLVIEATGQQGGRGDLLRVTATGIEVLAEAASLAVRTPVACSPCDDRFDPPAEEADDEPEPAGGEGGAPPTEAPGAPKTADPGHDPLPSVDQLDDGAPAPAPEPDPEEVEPSDEENPQ